jgi:hypothetical protein
MRVRRGLLFWGLVLIPLGGIPLIVRSGNLDGSLFLDAWKLWPLILVGVGIAVLVGRTRAALVGTAVIALTIGMIGGAALAAPNNWFAFISDCAPGGQTASLERTGTFSGNGSVRLDFRCGTLDVATGDGSDWSVKAEYAGNAPSVDSSGDRLTVTAASGSGRQRDEWTIRAPAAHLDDFDLTANAASSNIELGDAALARLVANINAGDVRIVAGSGGTDHVDITMNAGRIRLETGRAAMAGSLSINAGAIDLCVPADVGLRLDVTDQLTFATNLGSQGLNRSGNVWTRTAGGGAPTIELAIDGNAASLTLKPEGACR